VAAHDFHSVVEGPNSGELFFWNVDLLLLIDRHHDLERHQRIQAQFIGQKRRICNLFRLALGYVPLKAA